VDVIVGQQSPHEQKGPRDARPFFITALFVVGARHAVPGADAWLSANYSHSDYGERAH